MSAAALPHVEGLSLLVSLPAGGAQQLCTAALGLIINPDQDHDAVLGGGSLKGADRANVKAAHSALSTALLESAKLNLDAPALRSLLQEQGLANDQAEALGELYQKEKESLRRLLLRTSFGPPQLTGATWRLDHVVKSRHLDGEHRPLFFVKLLTVQPDGSEGKIEMTCTVEQLQDLYSRFSDAAKQIERTLDQTR